MRQVGDEGRREIAKELREQFYCCQYAEEFTEGLYDVLDLGHCKPTHGGFADSGMECTVKRYEYLLGTNIWLACCDEGVVRVDEMHRTCPDTFGALMNDIEAAMNCPASEEPTHAYNVASGMCDACADGCGGTLCQVMALHSICYRIHSLLAGDGE